MLPHRLNSDHLGTAVVLPPTTVEGSVSALERGFRVRAARDPGGVRKIVRGNVLDELVVPVKDPPAVRIPGQGRKGRHPVPYVGDIRRWGDWDQLALGTHGEMVARAQTPPGEQTRVSNVRGNTFRLRPQPWDAAQLIGYRPAPDET